MRSSDLFFIALILVIVCAGSIVAFSYASNPTTGTDTFGNAVQPGTNQTAQTITDTAAHEADFTGLFVVFIAVVLIIVVILG